MEPRLFSRRDPVEEYCLAVLSHPRLSGVRNAIFTALGAWGRVCVFSWSRTAMGCSRLSVIP